MKTILKSGIIISGIGAAAFALFSVLRPDPIEVEAHEVGFGPLKETVSGTGTTRFRRHHLVAAPIAGQYQPDSEHAGDTVVEGALLGRIAPMTSPILDDRTRRELRARSDAAVAQKAEAEAGIERARLALDWADSEHRRLTSLARDGAIARQTLDTAAHAVALAKEEIKSAELAYQTAVSQAKIARAALAGDDKNPHDGETIDVRSPMSGYVMQVFQTSHGPVQLGTPLMDIGDPESIEAVVELLTTDAVHVQKGAPVEVVRWGGEQILRGRVRLVEPQARTKVSALGIEEQRVRVIVEPSDPTSGWSMLGDGFHIEADITIWQAPSVLKVPGSALFAEANGWSAFVIENGRVFKRRVEVGRRNELEVQILSGLKSGERVVLYPEGPLTPNLRVAVNLR